MKPGIRAFFLLIFLSCAGLIGYALYLQLIKNLLPCPLCVVQRVAYWSVGLIALLAFLHNPPVTVRRIYSGAMAVFAFAGALPRGIRMRYQSGRKILECSAHCAMVAHHVRSKWRLRRYDLEIRIAQSSGLVGDFFLDLWWLGGLYFFCRSQ